MINQAVDERIRNSLEYKDSDETSGKEDIFLDKITIILGTRFF